MQNTQQRTAAYVLQLYFCFFVLQKGEIRYIWLDEVETFNFFLFFCVDILTIEFLLFFCFFSFSFCFPFSVR